MNFGVSGSKSFALKFDARTSVGYVRSECMSRWELEKLKLLCGDVVLASDYSRLLRVFKGKLTKSQNILTCVVITNQEQ